ncbi:hypothetical protein [Thaumasiovibrio sp. DFM-14]|uniref:hypothetical protein n=1 Tax=Thaumasiovibrio sp. DFM-14 TaxID=3384792 RepID=UPI0039A3DAC0
MDQSDFELLVRELNTLASVPEILEQLCQSKEEEVSAAAKSLRGQFQLAELEGQKRIYHVFSQPNEQGEEEEFAEWVMNDGDEMIAFIAWFFYSQFEIKDKETYEAAGLKLVQPKKLK